MSDDKLRILFIEDSDADVGLEERELRKAGLVFTSTRVETRDALAGALKDYGPTLVLSDFSLPQLDGMAALKLVRATLSDVPFLFVSGTIGVERAIETLKNGATDYVLKDHLGSLAVKVRRALSESREREDLRRVEGQLRQAQKMEAVGRLAGGLAHDFNNLLTVINGYSELMLAQLPLSHPSRAHAEEVLRAGERAASLTRQLLAFGRKQVLTPTVLDLNAVLAQVEKMLRRLIAADIELQTSPAPDLGRVKADPGQIEQVILNLSVNARDAMPKGGRLILETANVTLDVDDARSHPGIAPGPFVMLAVTDTGSGMTAETLSHLFEPFFTTKEPGKGAGLGLSMVHGIVQQSGGSVRVDSAPGRGTTFRVYLPRIDEASTAVPPRGPVSDAPRGTETILLVEDSDAVRRIMSTVLVQSGYRLIVAADGDEALRLLGRVADPVHLLITDVVLPRMSGPEVAGRILQARPGIKVLYTSGDTERGVAESGLPFLAKPFLPEALAIKVREVLGTPPRTP